jgi:hypothetical protein
MLIRVGVFLVILVMMLVTIEILVPVQGVPESRFSLEYLMRKNDLRPEPNPIQVRAP